MAFVTTFYFSRIVGKKVCSPSGATIGRIKDLIVDENFDRPKVVAVILRTSEGIITADFAFCNIQKDKGQYWFQASELKEFEPKEKHLLYLAKNILDRQIIDMDGRKLERVNDLRLATVSGTTYLMAADVGFEGFLRRLGVAKPLKKMLKPIGVTMPSHYILWDDVETVDFGNAGIRLSKDYSDLEKLHPSDLADIVEDMDRNAQIALLSTMDEEKVADILEELEPDAQRSVVENLPVAKAADLLEKMPADEAADILDELRNDKMEELLGEMETESSDDIRELMEYEDDEVGSIMTTDFLTFDEAKTVDKTLEEIRQLKPEPDTMYCLFVVNEAEKLTATVSLRDLIIAQPQTRLRDIMDTEVISVLEDDKTGSLNEIMTKYNLLAVPVVDAERKMVGVVIINDIVHNLLKNKMKRI